MTAVQPRVARPIRRSRHPAVVGSVSVLVVVLLALAHAFGFRLNLPTDRIERPIAADGPAAVATAYVEAYNARDFGTLRALQPGRTFPSRSRQLGHFTDLVVGAPRYDDGSSIGTETGPDPDHGRVFVPVTMTAHDMDVGETGWQDGPLVWGFIVQRDDASQSWVIVDQGPL